MNINIPRRNNELLVWVGLHVHISSGASSMQTSDTCTPVNVYIVSHKILATLVRSFFCCTYYVCTVLYIK